MILEIHIVLFIIFCMFDVAMIYVIWNLIIKQEMLEDCGECRVGDEVIEDGSTGNQSYQEFCILWQPIRRL